MMGFLGFCLNDSQEVFIASKESKTISGNPVFNKITWFSGKEKDIWMMNQSHHGARVSEDKWDRLAIVIEKTKSPKVAKFYQFKSGPLKWEEKLEEAPFKVSCFICHPNGPRVIRPNYDSPLDPTTIKDRLKVFFWNLKIKSYGRVIPHKSHTTNDKRLKPPFRWSSKYENEVLKIASCIQCHKEQGFLARGVLTRQNIPTIKFMLAAGKMPPFGFALSNEEKHQLKEFIQGF